MRNPLVLSIWTKGQVARDKVPETRVLLRCLSGLYGQEEQFLSQFLKKHQLNIYFQGFHLVPSF